MDEDGTTDAASLGDRVIEFPSPEVEDEPEPLHEPHIEFNDEGVCAMFTEDHQHVSTIRKIKPRHGTKERYEVTVDGKYVFPTIGQSFSSIQSCLDAMANTVNPG